MILKRSFLFLLILFFSATLDARAPKVESNQAEKQVCEVFFSPEDHLADKLVDLIDKEEKSIAIAVYAFTHKKIASALCAAKERGVQVELVIDPYSLNFASSLDKMAEVGIPIWIWDPLLASEKKVSGALMHDKFCLFGEGAVWTGSFNFTHKADSANQENALVIHDKAIAKKFKKQFNTLKARGCRPYPTRAKKPDSKSPKADKQTVDYFYY